MTFNFLEVCCQILSHDSTPSMGNMAVARYVGGLARQLGLHVEYQDDCVNGVEQTNVIIAPDEITDSTQLILQTHLDTVEPGSYGLWNKTNSNPFQASIRDQRIYGLGAADSKIDFICKLKALHEVLQQGLRPPVWLVGTYGEESGMTGAVKLVRKKKLKNAQALISEPTGRRIVHAGKGIAKVEIILPFSDEEKTYRHDHDFGEVTTSQSKVFNGRAGPSDNPVAAENAILKMFDYIAKLPEGVAIMVMEGGTNANTVPDMALIEIDLVGSLKQTIVKKILNLMNVIKDIELKSQNFPDHEFDPSHATFNIGLIRTHEDHIELQGVCRLPPSVSDEVYMSWMDQLSRQCRDIGGMMRVIDYKRPFRTKGGTAFYHLIKEELAKSGQDTSFGAQAAANEANVFSRFGLECLVWGPGEKQNSHLPNEYVELAHLQTAVEFYKNVMRRLA